MLLLLSGNRNYTITELAEKFNSSERTVQRYIASFKETGFVFAVSGEIGRASCRERV